MIALLFHIFSNAIDASLCPDHPIHLAFDLSLQSMIFYVCAVYLMSPPTCPKACRLLKIYQARFPRMLSSTPDFGRAATLTSRLSLEQRAGYVTYRIKWSLKHTTPSMPLHVGSASGQLGCIVDEQKAWLEFPLFGIVGGRHVYIYISCSRPSTQAPATPCAPSKCILPLQQLSRFPTCWLWRARNQRSKRLWQLFLCRCPKSSKRTRAR